MAEDGNGGGDAENARLGEGGADGQAVGEVVDAVTEDHHPS